MCLPLIQHRLWPVEKNPLPPHPVTLPLKPPFLVGARRELRNLPRHPPQRSQQSHCHTDGPH